MSTQAHRLRPWNEIVRPHADILEGDLEMATYAADLGAVDRADENTPRVYLDAREFFRTTAERLAEAALAVPPGTEFYRVDLAGQQVGFASSTVDTFGTTLRVTDLLLLDLPAHGRWHHSRVRSIAVVNRALRLEALQAEFEGDGGRFGAHAVVSGDSVLTLTLASGGDSQTARTRLAQPVVVPSLVPLRPLSPKPFSTESGRRYH